jgi:hypothetical protein
LKDNKAKQDTSVKAGGKQSLFFGHDGGGDKLL